MSAVMDDIIPPAALGAGSETGPMDDVIPKSAFETPSAGAAPTVYDAGLFRKRVGRDPSPTELANFKQFRGVGFAGDPTQGKFTKGEAAVGGAEDALSLATGIPASVAAAGGYLYGLTGTGGSDSLSAARAARDALTYQPRTEAGQAGMEAIGQIRPGEIVPRLLDVAGHPNAAQTVREVEERAGDVAPLAGEAAAGFPVTRGAGKRLFSPIQDPEAEISLSGMDSKQSMGAAAATPGLSSASPELQQAATAAAQKTGGAVNRAALDRHLEADTLPVPVQLTEGQALQEPTRLSTEQNMRGVHKELADRFNQQNAQLGQNLQAIRDEVGPDVFSTNAVEHGDTLIDAYQAKDKTARAAIDGAYDQARKGLSPNTPVLDAKQLQGDVNSLLEEKWATESAPADIMKRLQTLADGNSSITAGQFEGLRTRLAELARSEDGSTRYAANLIRGVVEDSDLLPSAQGFKASFDNARALARARFQAMEADPAYNAAVNETVSPDRFTQRFVTGNNATRDGVAAMRANLADNPVAQQTMGVAAVDHLRGAAIRGGEEGNFSQSSFNKQRQALDPKLRALVGPEHAETLERLGNVARYTQAQPRGSFVNNSNTFVASAAAHAGDLVEGAVNAKAGGVPVGSWARSALSKRGQKKDVRRMLAPGAGLDVLEAAK